MEGEGGAGVVRNHINVCHPLRDRFPSLFYIEALSSLKSFIDQIILLILVVLSQRSLHSAILQNQHFFYLTLNP